MQVVLLTCEILCHNFLYQNEFGEKRLNKKRWTKKYVGPCASPAKTGQCFVLQVAAFIRLNRNKDKIKIEIKYFPSYILINEYFSWWPKKLSKCCGCSQGHSQQQDKKGPADICQRQGCCSFGCVAQCLGRFKINWKLCVIGTMRKPCSSLLLSVSTTCSLACEELHFLEAVKLPDWFLSCRVNSFSSRYHNFWSRARHQLLQDCSLSRLCIQWRNFPSRKHIFHWILSLFQSPICLIL